MEGAEEVHLASEGQDSALRKRSRGTTRQDPERRLTPDDILAAHSPRVASLANRLRELVRGTIPTASEHAYPVWHAVGYRHPQAGYLCAVFPYESHVALAFEFGAFLPDPERVLRPGRTSSMRVRYLEVSKARDVRVRAIRALLLAAVRFRSRSPTRVTKPASRRD